MKPVYCSDKRGGGDCFRACIASILELPADAVPHVYCHDGDDPERDNAATREMDAFLRLHGLTLLRFIVRAESIDAVIAGLARWNPLAASAGGKDKLFLISGRSNKDDVSHCVVVSVHRGIVHNPSNYQIVGGFGEYCDEYQFEFLVSDRFAVAP
jgi:hypothetical protein